ncbi:V-type ATPase subunit [Dehalococcoidia bacterium]|nr:V-type ATPase subunit [Dehalococcoidia bacterium]
MLADPRYAFATAYLKAGEARVVTSEHLEGMLRASNLPEALELIQDTDIGSYLRQQTINEFDDFDTALWEYLQGHAEHLGGLRILPDEMRSMLKKHLVKYDVLNIKAALQGIAAQKKARMVPVGVICSRGLLDELSNVEDIESLIEIVRRCGLERYADVLSLAETVDVKSRLTLESRLDGAYYQEMLAAAGDLREGHVLSSALGFIIDLLNLQMVLRSVARGSGHEVMEYTLSGGYMLSGEVINELLSLKLPDIPSRLEDTFYYQVGQEVVVNYEKTHSLTAIEEVIDKHRFQLLRDTLVPRVMMSSLLISWYLILKEMELRNLRLVAKSLLDNISLDGAKSLLVGPS